MAETKLCEVCGQEIGSSEKICPKCQTNFDELEQEIEVIERAQNVLLKRKKASEPPPAAQPEPEPKRSIFSSLGRRTK